MVNIKLYKGLMNFNIVNDDEEVSLEDELSSVIGSTLAFYKQLLKQDGNDEDESNLAVIDLIHDSISQYYVISKDPDIPDIEDVDTDDDPTIL